MVRIPTRSLLGLAYLCLPVFIAAASSGRNDGEIVCSTTDAMDCYPRLFEPTKDFQDIREGQDIPPGLHVRLNIYTGQKEARLNIPMEGESDGPANAIPTEQAMVVVEQPETENEPDNVAPEEQALFNALAYDTPGKVSSPPPGDDMSAFSTAILMIQMDMETFDSALDDLLDLSHDIYYGTEIAKDGPVLERLVCFTLGAGTDKHPAKENQREHKAASILTSALQNNPNALKEVGDFWKIVMYPTCATSSQDVEIPVKGDFVSRLRNRLGKEKDPATLKAKITAISGLLKEPRIRADFLKKGGMEMLLAIFLKKGEQWDIVKQKVGQLVTDNFLDEGMGAQLGVWPQKPVSDSAVCETRGSMLRDGCWEYHLEMFSKISSQEWPKDLLAALGKQRAKLLNSKHDREL